MTVTNGYRIKDVAERSGFAPGTLRYYERLGLLPPPQRTDTDYRVYDDAALDRLTFIARAKEIGCSLDEIGDLTVAWEGGRCGPLQDRLRAVVADKIDDARRRAGELVALTAELQQAATQLERHRPDGACDGACGCVSNPGTAATSTRQPLPLLTGPAPGAAIACSLEPGFMNDRLDDWSALLSHAVRREPIQDGVRVVFGPTVPASDLMRLTVAEQSCCSFFGFAIHVDASGVAMEVTAPPEGRDVVTALFGKAA